jgi:hypothetical protein
MKFYQEAWFWLIVIPMMLSVAVVCFTSPERTGNFAIALLCFATVMSFGFGIKFLAEKT